MITQKMCSDFGQEANDNQVNDNNTRPLTEHQFKRPQRTTPHNPPHNQDSDTGADTHGTQPHLHKDAEE